MKFAFVLAITLIACGSAKPATSSTTPPQPTGEKVLVLVDDRGVGLGGHDPVAYATEGAVPGAAEHTAEHGGAIYRFASADNKTAFEADKPKHAPQYGGYCAFAASQNRLSDAEPTVFQVLDGQQLVFTNQAYKDQFNAGREGNNALADKNWPGLVARYGKPK